VHHSRHPPKTGGAFLYKMIASAIGRRESSEPKFFQPKQFQPQIAQLARKSRNISCSEGDDLIVQLHQTF
jgi:hypothetical protein